LLAVQMACTNDAAFAVVVANNRVISRKERIRFIVFCFSHFVILLAKIRKKSGSARLPDSFFVYELSQMDTVVGKCDEVTAIKVADSLFVGLFGDSKAGGDIVG